MVVGGVRHGLQRFNKTNASRNAILLALAVIALGIPSVFSVSMGEAAPITVSEAGHSPVEALSLGVAVIMIVLYALGLFDASRPRGEKGSQDSPLVAAMPGSGASHPGIGRALVILGLSTVGVAWLSEALVQVAEAVIADVGISEFFLDRQCSGTPGGGADGRQEQDGPEH